MTEKEDNKNINEIDRIYHKEPVEVEVQPPLLKPFFSGLRKEFFSLPKVNYDVESIYPESLYILSVGLSTSLVTVNRSLVTRTFLPLICSCAAFSVFLPKTTENILSRWGLLNVKKDLVGTFNSLKDYIKSL